MAHAHEAQPRTQKGALKKLTNLLRELEQDLEMAWSKTNPILYAKQKRQEIQEVKRQISRYAE